MKNLAFTFIILFFCLFNAAFAQTESEFLDSREGKAYQTIILKYTTEDGSSITKEWFAQNLDFKSEYSFCYKSEPAYCEVFGRLYLREASSSACPSGWHVPSSDEWQSLIKSYGGLENAGAALNEGGDLGLNLQMGGFGDVGNHYQGIGASGYYWSVKGASSELITIDASTDEILYDPIGNANKNSIRCVRN